MLTSVKYITDNLNNEFWDLQEYGGFNFEEYIYTILVNDLKPYYESGLRIVKTPNTRDDGIDIYIESPTAFPIMDIHLSLKGKNKIRTIIECKSTKHNKIALEKFAKNIIENDELDIDYFILVTNGTIVPHAYYKAFTKLEQSDCEFLLFDQYLLLQYLKKKMYQIPGTVSLKKHNNPIQIQYQLRKGKINGRNCFELYLDMRNYSDRPVSVCMNLISNRNWNIEEMLNTKLLPPYKGTCIRLIVKRVYNDGIDNFKLNVSYNNQSQILDIKNPEVVPDFQPPLTGKQHKKIIKKIYTDLFKLSSPQFYYIYGEAGIGKTRIIDEIVKKVFDTDYTIINMLCDKRKKIPLSALLYKKLALRKTDNSSWIDLINYFKNNSFTRYLFIIEDLHNATDEFYEQLKELIKVLKDCNCAIIMAGREDDTVYNESFFSCANWLKNHIKSFHIKCLKNNDCKLFIKSIIKDIPSIVLDKLLCVSKGNPFYIVQFIEYLLEIDFATLLNRNTVGMTNVNTFSSQRYIPSQVEKLIQKRRQHLLQLENGVEYINFLYILCLFGISAPNNIIEEYWGSENDDVLGMLFKKHYLQYDNNGNIKFDHETLFLFYSKEMEKKKNIQRISHSIVTEYADILKYLPDFQKAKVLFYAKKYSESEILFEPIIHSIENIHNISSTNLSREYFEYMDEIYQLAKRKKKIELQEKIIQASVYIPMHNMDYGTTVSAIEKALVKIKKYHIDNLKLQNTILQLKAHTELTAAKLKQAEQFFLELLAEERLAPDNFSPESQFDLFDRTASLYTRYNHKELAEKYNKLSELVAEKLDDPKLNCLTIMMKAKILFYSDTQRSIHYMEKAHSMMKKEHAYRTNCHNNVSITAANVMLCVNEGYINFSKYIKDAKVLLEEAIDNNYSFTIIRCNLLLAALYYLNEGKSHIEISKQYIKDGINASIRYGCEKLMNYFYNLKAVISIREGYSSEATLEYFDTMLEFLIKQNLLFLGNLDFCYGNIISITNYAKFIYNYGDEQRLYRFLSKLSYYQSDKSCDFDCTSKKTCYYSCNKNINVFKKNIKHMEEKHLIFVDPKFQYPLYDPYTGYYVIIH